MSASSKARWADQEKVATIQPLIPGVVAPLLTTFHIDRKVDEVVHFVPPVSREGGSFRVWVDGGLVEVKGSASGVKRFMEGNGKSKCYIRGRVSGFSAASRRRLMRFMAKLRTDCLPVFVTLTYPGEFPVDYRRWKYDLRKFAQRFSYHFPQAAFIWRLEPQKRGAPHFHLLIYGVDYTSDFASWCASSWYRVVASGDPKHLEWGSNVQPVRSQRGVRFYVGKYIAKKQVEPDSTSSEVSSSGNEVVDWSQVGRWWGVRAGSNLPFSSAIGASGLDGHVAQRVMRVMRGFLRSRTFRISGLLKSLTMFTDSPLQWLDCIEGCSGGEFPSTGSFRYLEGFT